MEHYTLLLRQLFSTPYYEKDNIFVHVYCQKGWGVIKVCTVYYSTAVYSTVLCFTVLYYRDIYFSVWPHTPTGGKNLKNIFSPTMRKTMYIVHCTRILSEGGGVIKVCTVYYSTAVYSTILYYRVFIFLFDPPPPGQKYDQMNCWWKKNSPYLQYCKTKAFNFSHAVRTPSL